MLGGQLEQQAVALLNGPALEQRRADVGRGHGARQLGNTATGDRIWRAAGGQVRKGLVNGVMVRQGSIFGMAGVSRRGWG